MIYLASPVQPADWSYYGGDASSTKYSPLAQIHRDNFADLRIISRWRPPEAEILAEHDVDREAYLRAFDPATGELVGQVELPGNPYASPAVYQADDRQYVVLSLGDSYRPSELVALAIPRPGETIPEQGKSRKDADH